MAALFFLQIKPQGPIEGIRLSPALASVQAPCHQKQRRKWRDLSMLPLQGSFLRKHGFRKVLIMFEGSHTRNRWTNASGEPLFGDQSRFFPPAIQQTYQFHGHQSAHLPCHPTQPFLLPSTQPVNQPPCSATKSKRQILGCDQSDPAPFGKDWLEELHPFSIPDHLPHTGGSYDRS